MTNVLIFCSVTLLALLVAASFAWDLPSDDPKEIFRNHGRAKVLPRYRLPREITPTNYKLEIWPILDEDVTRGERFTAPGQVWIDMETHGESVNNITLNSVWINVTRIWLKENGTDLFIDTYTFDEQKEFLYIFPVSPLKPNTKYNLQISYTAPITEPEKLMAGLYRTSYINGTGVRRWLAVTDFESVDARRMVPCFDEPDLKATWEITVVRQNDYTSLSNFNLKSSTPDPNFPDWTRDEYEKTELMPTYLVAICVSDYDSRLADSAIGYSKPARIWGPENLLTDDGTQYTADLSAKLLQSFENLLGYEYTFPKMDSVGLNDFSAGAMENWGMNTYRMVRLIYIPGNSTLDEKFRMTNTISHELAHQWFGNLITMEWWDDIWLNEGFATYMANMAVAELPDDEHMQMADWVIVDSVQYAFQADVRASSHPLKQQNITTPGETRAGFSTISYDKGASILRMISNFMTPTLFQEGLTEYLLTHNYSNAHKDDLSNALEKALTANNALDLIPASMASVLDTWTTQTGFPLIIATYDNTTQELKIRQEAFRNNTFNGTEPKTWYVPVSWSKGPTENGKLWINNTAEEVLVKFNTPIGGGDLILLNEDQHGYYRVQYDKGSFNLIRANFGSLSSKTQSMILDDYLNLGFSHYQGMEESLSIICVLKSNRALPYLPWHSFFTNMAVPNRMLLRTSAYYYYSAYLRDLLQGAYSAIGGMNYTSGEDALMLDKVFLRNRLVEWSCSLRLADCVNDATEAVEEWLTSDTRPFSDQPDLRPYAYCAAMANAGSDLSLLKVWYTRQYREVSTAQFGSEHTNILRGLSCMVDQAELTSLLDSVLNEDKIVAIPAHKLLLMQYIAANPVGLGVLQNFVVSNAATIINNPALGPSALTSLLSTIGDYLYTASEKRWVEYIGEQFKDSISAASVASTVAKVENNMQWHEMYYQSFRTFFMNSGLCP